MKVPRHVALLIAVLAIGAVSYLGYQRIGLREPAPRVAYALLGGQTAALEQLRGKVVLLNFWATSRATCFHEMPQIVATHHKFKSRGYETLAIAMSYDPPAYVAKFAESRHLPLAVAIDTTGRIAKDFGDVRLTPTTYLIARSSSGISANPTSPRFTSSSTAAVAGLIGEQRSHLPRHKAPATPAASAWRSA